MASYARKALVAAAIATFSTGLTGCAQPKANMTVELPPNSEAAASLRRVAVLPFQGPSGEQVSLEFESLLAQVNQDGRPYFTVVDRRALQNAMNELKLQYSGLTDPDNVAKFGKFIGVDGIYTGTVFLPPAVRQTHSEQRIKCNDLKCKSSSTYSVTCGEKVVQYTLVPRLVAVATAQVVYQPTLTAGRKARFCQDGGPEPANELMLVEARGEVFRKVSNDVGPHTSARALALRSNTDGMNADVRQRFDDAMAFATAGRMDRACGVWSDLLSTHPDNITLAYNLGVCDEAAGRLEQALDRYTKVDRGLKRPDAEINAALTRVRESIAAVNKLEATALRSPSQVAKPNPGTKVPATSSDDQPAR